MPETPVAPLSHRYRTGCSRLLSNWVCCLAPRAALATDRARRALRALAAAHERQGDKRGQAALVRPRVSLTRSTSRVTRTSLMRQSQVKFALHHRQHSRYTSFGKPLLAAVIILRQLQPLNKQMCPLLQNVQFQTVSKAQQKAAALGATASFLSQSGSSFTPFRI